MKQFVVALLAAFAISSPAFAGSIDYDTGTFESAKMTGSFSNKLTIDIIGKDYQIDISTGKLTKNMSGCPSGSICFDFTGGSVSVDGGKVFKDAINGGITITENGVASISATLAKETGVSSGVVGAEFAYSGNKITTASANLVRSVPEPTAFSLLGMGLISFLGFRRMKTSL